MVAFCAIEYRLCPEGGHTKNAQKETSYPASSAIVASQRQNLVKYFCYLEANAIVMQSIFGQSLKVKIINKLLARV